MHISGYLAFSLVVLGKQLYGIVTGHSNQQLLQSSRPTPQNVSAHLFAELEDLARLVDIAYCVGTTGLTAPFLCASRCKDFPSFELETTWNTGALMSDSCGYVAVDHRDTGSSVVSPRPSGTIFVAFRGTYSLANTVVDLSTIPQDYRPYPEDRGASGMEHFARAGRQCSNCTVHTGFFESWRQARKLVLPALESLRQRYPGYKLQLIGHSLGGSVAALAALELKEALKWEKIQVTTFGEPQIGNAEFVRYLNAVFDLEAIDRDPPDLESTQYRRITHVDDPVPLLPLAEWSYRPHAGEIYISNPELPIVAQDLHFCKGDADPNCIANSQTSRYQLWELLFAHRDYFWRLGLCVPPAAIA